jgi:NTE family protein
MDAVTTEAPKTGGDARRVLVLQGGGALGSYQGGVYEGLAEADFRPDWIAGISIGAINAAIIAGNAPENRLARLREFWETASATVPFTLPLPDSTVRTVFNEAAAAWTAAVGVAGFFRPRLPPAMFYPPGSPEALSYYDTAPLRATLERLVDFDRINAKEVRLSLGAVNVRSGQLVYFDNKHQTIGPEHVMASGALPPGFPPIEIEGEHYWDGGVVSNTPLQYVMQNEAQ